MRFVPESIRWDIPRDAQEGTICYVKISKCTPEEVVFQMVPVPVGLDGKGVTVSGSGGGVFSA